jgi:peptidoglycan/LPS O-acetylase OafA/YrhL
MSHPHYSAPDRGPQRAFSAGSGGETIAAPVPPAIAARNKPIQLSQSSSLLLDIIRFSAALVVLKSHLSMDHRWALLAHAAVCVFFALSGFIIRFITVTRITAARIDSPLDYSIDRVSRIYSVALPAILFTALCILLAHAINPAAFAHLSDFMGWGRTAMQFAMNLTWTAQCWGYNIFPPDNAPFWSLSYECIYYAVYALIFYRARHCGLWVVLLLILAGPSIAFLYPVWLIGAGTCDLYLRLRNRPNAVLLSAAALAVLLSVLALARNPLLAFLRWSDVNHRSAWLTHLVLQHFAFPPHLLNSENFIPWLIEASPSYYFVALVTSAAILFGMLALDRYHPSLPPAVTRGSRLIADSTFALYLFHAPLVMLVAVIVGHDIRNSREAAILMFAIPLAVIPLAMALDHLKRWMRTRLYRRFAPRTAHA